MAKIDAYEMPDELYYHKEHTWVRVEYKKVRIGATDYAQKSAGDIVYVDLPFEGDEVTQNEPFGKMQSAKWIGELYSPISGKIVAVNDLLNSKPTLINQSPYESGWIIAVQPSMLEDELKNLFNGEAAVEWIKEQIKKAVKEGYAVKE